MLAIFLLFLTSLNFSPSEASVINSTPTENVSEQTDEVVSITPSISPSPEPTSKPYYKVTKVIDANTIEIDNNEIVRLIGISVPSISSTKKVYDCYTSEAHKRSNELLLNATISLESDTVDKDNHGRLLRYVYKDEVFTNNLLIINGYAEATQESENVKHLEQFSQSEKKAKASYVGLWDTTLCAITPSPTPKPKVVPKPTPSPTIKPTAIPQPSPVAPAPTITPVNTQEQNTAPSNNSFACDCSKTCPNLSCAEAQFQLNNCGCGARDGDNDGVACDQQCQ